MEVHIQVPEDIATNFGPGEGSLERAILEGFAVEGVRSGRLSRGQLRRLLGFATRYEVDGFLKSQGVPVEESFDAILESSKAILTHGRGLS